MKEQTDADNVEECKSEDSAQRTEAPNTDTSKDEELDIYSTKFNPLRALYTEDFNITKKRSKVMFQNHAAFESALKKHGLWGLGQTTAAEQPSGSKSKIVIAEDINVRRFRPEQMPVLRTHKMYRERNVMTQMKAAEGPLAALYKMVTEKSRVRVDIRRLKGVRGHIEGTLVLFDKYWNLLLTDVVERYKRRKFKYTENKVVGTPKDCAEKLRRLCIQLPEERVQSLNRKNVIVERNLGQLFVRGDEVVLVYAIPNEVKES